MRTLLLIAALTLAAPVATPADACGFAQWAPPAYLVVTPGVHAPHSFALLDTRLDTIPATPMTFTRVDDRSDDDTAIAPGRQLPDKLHLTLVGSAGTKLVQADRLTWIDMPYDDPREAVAIPAGFSIALSGDFKDATWETYHASTSDPTFTGTALGVLTIFKTRYIVVEHAVQAELTFVRLTSSRRA